MELPPKEYISTQLMSSNHCVLFKCDEREDGNPRTVAWKTFPKSCSNEVLLEARLRLLRERFILDTLELLDVPRVPRCRGPGWAKDHLVMDFVDGCSMQASLNLITEADNLSDLLTALTFAKNLSETVSCCHNAGIAHGSVYPCNVILKDGDWENPVSGGVWNWICR